MKKRRKGVAGCCGCFALLAVLTVVGMVGFGYWLAGPAMSYERVNFSEDATTISEAPEKPTLYWGQNITYAAPPTEVPIAIIGSKNIQISGDFLDNVMLISPKVVAAEGSRFAKNLDIKAAEFTDEGITLKGKLTGKVMNSTN